MRECLMGRLLAALCLLVAQVPAALPTSAPGMSAAEREMSHAILHQVREDLERYYYDPSFHGVDLGAKFQEAESLIDRATSLADATATINDVVMALDDPHTIFFPPSGSARVDFGWTMSMAGDLAVVVNV